jgi:hypothetical protein
MSTVFESWISQIEDEYSLLGHQMGWRFLSSPRRTLKSELNFALINLNPGGSAIDPTHGVATCEQASAFVHESWKGRPPGQEALQVQVRGMFEWLALEPDEAFAAYFVPFRSPGIDSLHRSRESFAFARSLWQEVLNEIHPRLIVCLGNEIESELISILGPQDDSQRIAVNWGSVTATVNRYPDRVLLRLPHLSRFRIFGRHESAAALGAIRELIA